MDFEMIPKLIAEWFTTIRPQSKKKLSKDVLIAVVLLCFFGIVMVFSASMYEGLMDADDPDALVSFKSQLKVFILSFVVMVIVSLLDYKYYYAFADILFVFTIFLLILTMFIGSESNGGQRWIFGIQPSEFVKITAILFMAKFGYKYKDEIGSVKFFFIFLVIVGGMFLLVYFQPALSAAVIICALIAIMFFVEGGNFPLLAGFAGAGFALMLYIVNSTGWRADRVAAQKDVWSNIYDTGWQPAQSLMALGSGGLFGKGIGSGRAKLLFLPEAANDYIFSIIGEETGFIGCMLVIAAFMYLLYSIMRISTKADTSFGRYICIGMTVLIAMQVFLNIAVVTNIIPSTGVCLPFISSGGSSMLSMMIGIGIVLNISRNMKEAR